MISKLQLRKEIKNKKRQFPSQQLHELSFAVITRLLAHPRVKSAKTIMLYHSLPDEVDTHTIVDSLLMSGKTILLPRVTGEGTMELHRYNGPKDMQVGAYGIMEPTGEVYTDYSNIDLAVVPGVAFDHDGNRMGRGKGYYDRFLPLIPDKEKIGVCFPFQMITSIPAEEHDIRMDEIITSE